MTVWPQAVLLFFATGEKAAKQNRERKKPYEQSLFLSPSSIDPSTAQAGKLGRAHRDSEIDLRGEGGEKLRDTGIAQLCAHARLHGGSSSPTSPLPQAAYCISLETINRNPEETESNPTQPRSRGQQETIRERGLPPGGGSLVPLPEKVFITVLEMDQPNV